MRSFKHRIKNSCLEKRRQNTCLSEKDFMGIYDNRNHAGYQLKGNWVDAHGTEDETTFNCNKFL